MKSKIFKLSGLVFLIQGVLETKNYFSKFRIKIVRKCMKF